MITRTGNLAIDGELYFGTIAFDDRIREVRIHKHGPAAGGELIIPGFIDVHVHGGGGGDMMDGPHGVRTMAEYHLTRGSTSIVPTTITDQNVAICAAMNGVQRVIAEDDADHASILGVHIEGPYIHPDKLGAQPSFARPLYLPELQDWLGTGIVRIITVAPELSGTMAALPMLAQNNVRVSIGHTLATYDETVAFIAAARSRGIQTGYTHLYNAMPHFLPRAPGVVGAALTDEHSFAEIILDTHHVHTSAALIAYTSLGKRLILVSDAIRAAGKTHGHSEFAGRAVEVHGGVARLPDGTLAGSIITMWDAFVNAQVMGLTVAQASYAASTAPARYLGLTDRGVIKQGARADLLVLTTNGSAVAGYVRGREFILAVNA